MVSTQTRYPRALNTDSAAWPKGSTWTHYLRNHKPAEATHQAQPENKAKAPDPEAQSAQVTKPYTPPEHKAQRAHTKANTPTAAPTAADQAPTTNQSTASPDCGQDQALKTRGPQRLLTS